MINVPDFLAPETIEEAVALLAEHGEEAKILAGGTGIVLFLKFGFISPAVLVSLHRIRAERHVAIAPGEELRLGSLATLRDVERSQAVRAKYPFVADTYGTVGNIRVRHAATVGGNVCEADYASDPPCLLVALDAIIKVRSLNGSRTIAASDFFRGYYETALSPEDLVTEVIVPALPAVTAGSYVKFMSRSSEDRPCVGVATVMRIEDGRCMDLRVSIGAVAPTPQRFPDLEQEAHGQILNVDLIRDVAHGYAARIEPLSDLRGSAWYRKQMIRVLVARAIQATAVKARRSEMDHPNV